MVAPGINTRRTAVRFWAVLACMQDSLAAAVYNNMVAVNGGPRDDADPDEVVDDGRWAGAVGAARLNVPNKLTGGQLDGIGLAERVAL